jgi:hypothetical protein
VVLDGNSKNKTWGAIFIQSMQDQVIDSFVSKVPSVIIQVQILQSDTREIAQNSSKEKNLYTLLRFQKLASFG